MRKRSLVVVLKLTAAISAGALLAACAGDSAPVITETTSGGPVAQGTPADQVQPWRAGILRADGSGPGYPTTWPASVVQGAGSSTSLSPILSVPADTKVAGQVDVEVVNLTAGGGFGGDGSGPATGLAWSGRAPANAIALPAATPVLAQGSTYAWRVRSAAGKPWIGPWAFSVDAVRASTAPADNHGGVSVNLLSGVVSTSWGSAAYPGAAGALRIGAVYRSGTAPTPGLPANWSWQLPGSGLIRLTESKVTGGAGDQAGPMSVTLSSGDGAGPTFVRTPTGAYVPGLADGTATSYAGGGVLTRVQSGVWEFTAPDGTLIRFESGRAVGEWAGGVPVVAFAWDGQGRLATLSDGVPGGRTMAIMYGGGTCAASGWEGFSVPDGLWCAVSYPDQTTTQVGYVDGRIAMIADAGGTGIGFGWDGAGRLARVRGTAATMAAATDAAWRVDETATAIAYDRNGRVESVTDPATEPGGSRVRHTYAYPTEQGQTLRARVTMDVLRSGDAPVLQSTTLGNGVVSIIEARSDTWQSLKSTGGDGLSSTMAYSASTGTLMSGTTPNGRTVSMNSDAEGLAASAIGPFLGAPSGALTTARTFDSTIVDPDNAATSSTKPWEGLSATVWSGSALGGSPQWWNRTTLGEGLGGSFKASPTGVAEPWRAQATGLWRIAQSGQYRIELTASTRARVDLTIDGVRCVDASGAAGCTVRLAKGERFIALSVNVAAPDGAAAFSVTARGQGVSGRIPIADLRPNFNVATRVVTNDVIDGRNLASKAFDFDQPWAGSPSGVTSAGGLKTAFGYEATDPSRGEYGRPLTMTTAGGSTQTMTYYGVGETATNPCTNSAIPQAGQLRSVTRYDGVVVSNVYDSAGRTVAIITTGAGATELACFAYDPAGRLVTSSVTGIDGEVLEQTTTTYTMISGRLVQVTTVKLGDAAPVQPGSTFVTTVVVDTASQVVEITEPNGTRTVREYDVFGNPTRRTVSAPGAQQPTLDVVSTYDPLTGWLSAVAANGTTLAEVTYDRYGLPSAVAYVGGAKASVSYDGAGSANQIVLTGTDGQIQQSRSRNAAGRTTASQIQVSGATASSYAWRYTYDSAGRLTAAQLSAKGDTAVSGGASRAVTYDYGRAPAGCAAGAAANLERTGGSRDGTAYQTCRDERGRLAWTTDPKLAASGSRAEATYDALGRLTGLSGAVPLAQTWWYGTQVATITEGSTDADRTVHELLVAGGVLLERTYTDAAGTTVTRYGYGGGSSPALLLGADDEVLDVRVDLPGGARAHLTPQQPVTIEHADLYGAALAVTRGGQIVGGGLSSLLGPYGEPLADASPQSGATTGIGAGTTYSFQAAAGNPTLTGAHPITMTARPYHPWLGEFLAFDPSIGASSAGYGYGDGNPVDKPDYSGGEGLWDLIGVAGAVLAAVGGVASGKINIGTSSVAKVAAVGTMVIGSAAAIAGTVGTWMTSDDTTTSAITTALAAVGMAIAGHSVATKIVNDRTNTQLLRQYVTQASELAEAEHAGMRQALEAKRLQLYKPMKMDEAYKVMAEFNEMKTMYDDLVLASTGKHFGYIGLNAPQSFRDWFTSMDTVNQVRVPKM